MEELKLLKRKMNKQYQLRVKQRYAESLLYHNRKDVENGKSAEEQLACLLKMLNNRVLHTDEWRKDIEREYKQQCSAESEPYGALPSIAHSEEVEWV
jgi:hypothetical protein